MGQGLHKVKRRIQTVDSTRKITSSMKLVSSVKFSKLQKVYENRLEFHDALKDFGNDLFTEAKLRPQYRKYFEGPEGAKKNLYVVVTSNMGLCGSYKHNVQKYLESVYKEGDDIILIGTSLLSFLTRDGNIDVNTDFINMGETLSMASARILAKEVFKRYSTNKYKKISLIYTHYINVISYEVKEFSLLPLEFKESKESYAHEGLYEPSFEYIFERFIKKHITLSLYMKIFDSNLSEQSSRRNAMDNADKNAKELIDKLTLEYNKARQASITQEITEVVAGSANK